MLFELSDREFFFDPFSMHFFASPSNPIPDLTRDDLSPAYVSRLLHEVTHLDCMRTDLGTGLIMGMLWLQKKILSTSASDPLLTSDGQTIPDPRTGKTMLLQPLLITKILPRFASSVPVLEGLAMFAQLDLRFSSEEVSSLQFRASLSLLAQAGETDGPLLVAQFHDGVRKHAILEEHLLHRLLYGVDRRNSYYLFGYIFVKSLAYILREKEPRFRDPEMAYLFLRAFLLNGGDYVHEGVLGPGGVSEQLQQRLDQLLACPRELLRAAYDVLAEDTTDRLTGMDWAHFMESGSPRSSTDEPLLRATLDHLGIDHDDLMSLVVSMDFVPLKMVMGRIAFAKIESDHVLLVIASGVDDRGAVCTKWMTRDDFAIIEQQGRQNDKTIPIVEDLPLLENAFEAIGDPDRVSVLWTSAFSAEKLMRINLWSFPEAVFSDDGELLRRLPEDATTYMNFFKRRRFADFIFNVVGQRLPGARLMLWDFCHFVFSKLMTVEGGRKFDLLLQNGFSSMSGLDLHEPLSAAAREQLNGILLYPVFD